MCREGQVPVEASTDDAILKEPSPSQTESTALPQLPSLPSIWAAQFRLHPDTPVIGSGAYGTIFQVLDLTNRPFAVKVMQRHFFEIRGLGDQLSMEVQAMHRAGAVSEDGWSRVVKLYAWCEEAGCVFMLLELCFYGNLRHQLNASPGGLSECNASRSMRHLLEGLRDTHAAGFLHRDIKLDNLLITTNGVLKVTDFGWARESKEAPRGLAGTFETMAPEILRDEAQTEKVDIWSAGAVLFHILCGRPLLQCATDADAALKEIEAMCPLKEESRPAHMSETCWDLLRRLLEDDVTKRPTAEEALAHSWLQKESAAQYTCQMGGA